MDNEKIRKALVQRSIWRKIFDPTVDGIYEVDGERITIFGLNFLGMMVDLVVALSLTLSISIVLTVLFP